MEENKLNIFEEMLEDELLIDLFKKKEVEIFESVVFQGKKRYYIEDLTERDYFLENTTPYQVKIGDVSVEATAWGVLLVKTFHVLMSISPKTTEELLDFRCPWSSNKIIFSTDKKTNFKQVGDSLYINCNHTALHSCWLLQDLLDFFNIDKSSVCFLIHRPCGAEPKNVIEYIEKKTINGFKDFLVYKYNKSPELADKIILNIDKHINYILSRISKSYNNIFLFDDNTIMSGYIKKVRNIVNKSLKYGEKNKKILNKYLDLIQEYFKN